MRTKHFTLKKNKRIWCSALKFSSYSSSTRTYLAAVSYALLPALAKYCSAQTHCLTHGWPTAARDEPSVEQDTSDCAWRLSSLDTGTESRATSQNNCLRLTHALCGALSQSSRPRNGARTEPCLSRYRRNRSVNVGLRPDGHGANIRSLPWNGFPI